MKKFFWSLRFLLLKPFLRSSGFFSYIGKPLLIKGVNNLKIGNKVRIYPGSRIECHNGGVINIMDDCSIGQNFHIISTSEELIIGSSTTISGNVFVTNMDHQYSEINKHILKQPLIYKKTIIGENCFIGFGAAIQAGSILGNQCIVGANSVVRGTFPSYCVIAGVPAKIIKLFNPKTESWEKI